jgi:hypothetical protein
MGHALLAAQEMPSAMYVDPASWHCVRVTRVHAPEALQHAPVGWGQVVLAHDEPLP